MAVTVTRTLSRQQRRWQERQARKQVGKSTNTPAKTPTPSAPYGTPTDNLLTHTNLSAPAHARLVSTLQGYGNNLADDHVAALGLLCGVMTRMAAGELRGRYAFGLPTGMGKTSAIIAWLSRLTELGLDDISVAVSASKVEALCELKRDLIKAGVPPKKIGLIHSKKYDPNRAAAVRRNEPNLDNYASEPSEPQDRQIMLVTHQRVRGCSLDSFYRYKGKPRDLLLYDESLIVSDSTGVPINFLRAGVSWLDTLHGTKERYKPVVSYLKQAVEAIASVDNDDSVIKLPEITEEELQQYRSVLSSHQALDAVHQLLNIAMYEVRVIRDGSGGAVWYQIAVPPEIKNILILDASTPIRQLVSLDKTIIDVECPHRGLPEVRRLGCSLSSLKKFDQVTIHQMFKGGGRTTLDQSFKQERAEDRRIVKEVIGVVKEIPEDEGILVFTYKQASRKSVDFRSVLLSDLEDAGVDTSATLGKDLPRISVLSWGQETSLNCFSHCQHVILCGVLQRSPIDLAAAYLGQTDDIQGEVSWQTIQDLRRSEQCHLIYQALSRGSCRVIDNGHAKKMTGYIIEKDCLIKKDLDRVIPGARWLEWESKTGVKPGVIDSLAKKIEDHLEGLPQETDKISTTKLKKEMGVANDLPRTTWTSALQAFASSQDDWVQIGRSLARNSGTLYGF